jgi:hypothetical protein
MRPENSLQTAVRWGGNLLMFFAVLWLFLVAVALVCALIMACFQGVKFLGKHGERICLKIRKRVKRNPRAFAGLVHCGEVLCFGLIMLIGAAVLLVCLP